MGSAKYKVDNVSFRPTFNGAGRPIDVYDITFTELSTGHTGQVSVPKESFNDANVAAAIQPVADTFAALSGIGGGE